VSYEEKGQWVYLIANVLTFGGYAAIMAGQVGGGGPVADIDYVPTLLTAIGIAVGLSVLGRILVEIVYRSDSYKEDVRDRDIGRFGEYVAGLLLGVGMLVPFGLTIIKADHFWIANAMYAAFALSAFVGTVVRLVAYRRGL
jgi:drug/metabolite transporter (DMT)-like permease